MANKVNRGTGRCCPDLCQFMVFRDVSLTEIVLEWLGLISAQRPKTEVVGYLLV